MGAKGMNVLGFKHAPLAVASKLDQCGEHQRHVAPLVHDRRAAVRAPDLAGEVMRGRTRGRAVEGEALGAAVEGHVPLVEDGGPLERGAWEPRVRRSVSSGSENGEAWHIGRGSRPPCPAKLGLGRRGAPGGWRGGSGGEGLSSLTMEDLAAAAVAVLRR